MTTKSDSKKLKERLPPNEFRLTQEDVYKPLNSFQEKFDIHHSGLTVTEEDILPIGRMRSNTIYAANGDIDVSLFGFEIKKVIGRGSFGKVFLAKYNQGIYIY